MENIAFGLRAKKVPAAEARSRAVEMLDIVRLGEFAARRPAQLSGGQQQRVALARALVNMPSALLLDEPLAALDLKLREAMQLELKRIQREVGITFIFVTHDQGEALTMSDRIAVMSRGQVEQIGTPEEIYAAPASIFVAGFIGSANLLPGTLVGAGDGRAVARLDSGQEVAVMATTTARAGDPVTVMLRPERLSATTDASTGGDRSLGGVIENVIFQGSERRLIVHLPDDAEVGGHDRRRRRPAPRRAQAIRSRCSGRQTPRTCCAAGRPSSARRRPTSTRCKRRSTVARPCRARADRVTMMRRSRRIVASDGGPSSPVAPLPARR